MDELRKVSTTALLNELINRGLTEELAHRLDTFFAVGPEWNPEILTDTVQAAIEYCQGGGYAGYQVCWYGEDADGRGWVQFWGGTREQCEERAKQPPDADAWHPADMQGDGGPPYDHATATGMYDR